MERKILIEIQEPDFMDLVNSEEKEELDSKVVEIIRGRVFELFSVEMRKLLKERYNLSLMHMETLLGRRGFLESVEVHVTDSKTSITSRDEAFNSCSEVAI